MKGIPNFSLFSSEQCSSHHYLAYFREEAEQPSIAEQCSDEQSSETSFPGNLKDDVEMEGIWYRGSEQA
jgi:hypothetical protein